MPAYDDDQLTGESEGEFHSFNEDLLPEFSNLDSPVEISVDPLSLRAPRNAVHSPVPPLIKPKSVNSRLPSSALSKMSHPEANSFARQHSAAVPDSAELQNALRWSKSRGEGRSSAPSDEFIEILSRKPSIHNRDDGADTACYSSEEGSFKNTDIDELRARRSDAFKCGCVFLPGRSQKKKQVAMQADKVDEGLQPKQFSKQVSLVFLNLSKQETEAKHVMQAETDSPKQASTEVNSPPKVHTNHQSKQAEEAEQAAELLQNQLKQVMEVLDIEDDTEVLDTKEEGGRESIHIGRESFDIARASTVSKAMSLERFDCASWSSSAILDGIDDDDDDDEDNDDVGGRSYFDLPMELIRFGQNDTDSPVSAAFVFEKDLKGVIKHSKSRLASGNSQGMSNSHVRFSTSMPSSYPASPSSSCTTPRLRKAREEFNAFLEAQSA